MWKRFCILVCLVAFGASAETYDAWLHGTGPSGGDLTVQYQHWAGFVHAQPTWWRYDHGGYEGDLLVRAASSTHLQAPLRVRWLFSMALKSDIITPTNGWAHWSGESGASIHIRPDGVIRETLFTDETTLTTVPQGQGALVPLVFPRRAIAAMRTEPQFVVGRYEVVDAAGVVLARGLAPRLLQDTGGYGQETAAWVTEDVEADRLLRETANIRSAETVLTLPRAMAAYEGLSALWVSQPTWQERRDDLAFWRRVLLQGVSLYARTNTVEAMRAALQVAPDGWVLRARLASSMQLTVGDDCSGPSRESIHILDLNETRTAGREVRERSLLDNDRPLFLALQSYQLWTICILGVFALGTVVVMALAFVRLQGAKRVRLWWLVPLWAIGFSLLGGGVGRLVLSRQPRADVTEYRFARSDWPDMFCEAEGRTLCFFPAAHGWLGPAQARFMRSDKPSYAGGQGGDIRVQCDGTSTCLRLEAADRGNVHDDCAGWFRPCELPFRITPAGQGERHIRATGDLDAVFVWADGVWHTLGALKTGEERDPYAASNATMARLPGLPKSVAERLPKIATSAHGQHTPAAGSDKPDALPWVVVALRKGEVGLHWLDDRSIRVERTIWVVQVPMETGRTASTENL